MTAEHAATRTVRLSETLSVTITASRIGVSAEWSPAPPDTLSDIELHRYREARNAVVAEVANRLGGRAVVIEVAS
jgi:hypothetical protein